MVSAATHGRFTQEFALKTTDRASQTNNTNESILNQPINGLSNFCAHCQADAKSRRRDFSEQTWTVLHIWGEIDTKTVDKPICEPCYNELREVLIDRTEEIAAALAEHSTGSKPAAMPAGKARPVTSKSEKSKKMAG